MTGLVYRNSGPTGVVNHNRKRPCFQALARLAVLVYNIIIKNLAETAGWQFFMTRLSTSNSLRPCTLIIGCALSRCTTLTVHLAVHQKVIGHFGIKTLRYWCPNDSPNTILPNVNSPNGNSPNGNSPNDNSPNVISPIWVTRHEGNWCCHSAN